MQLVRQTEKIFPIVLKADKRYQFKRPLGILLTDQSVLSTTEYCMLLSNWVPKITNLQSRFGGRQRVALSNFWGNLRFEAHSCFEEFGIFFHVYQNYWNSCWAWNKKNMYGLVEMINLRVFKPLSSNLSKAQ